LGRQPISFSIELGVGAEATGSLNISSFLKGEVSGSTPSIAGVIDRSSTTAESQKAVFS
jgi:hypothetical protein